ncbi:MAG: hypothetical protein JWM68_374 [Verrucomicrobiales bacterium]|nr:hypothetical protein [Verrucomicrobiales bacterium]
MSFGGSSNNLPPPPINPLGINKNRGATNQMAIPLPYFCGKNRLGVKWISDIFADRAAAVYNEVGKGDTNVSGYNFFTDIACALSHGVVDGIYSVIFNGVLVWGKKEPYDTPQITRGAEDSIDITIPNFGVMTLYWGTETQTFNTTLKLSGKNHTAYRGVCYAVFKQLFLGFNQKSVQNIEIVLGRWPKPAWIDLSGPGHDGTSNINGDVNPICFIVDLLQHPRAGLGLPDSFFDMAKMQAVAQRLQQEGFGFSPLLTDRKDSKQWLLQACEYFDGYFLQDGSGKFSIQLARPPEDAGELTIIDGTQMVSRPSFSSDDWSTIKTETSVQFTSDRIGLQPDVKTWRDLGAREMNDSADPLQVDRSWITQAESATQIAACLGQVVGLPIRSGSVKLRKTGTLFEDMVPGALFKFDYPSRNVGGIVWRVKDRSQPDPSEPEFQINFLADTSYLYPAPGNGSFSREIGEEDEESEEIKPLPISTFRVIELPLALCPEGKLSLAILAARAETSTIGFNIFLGRKVNSEWLDSYAQLDSQRSFSVHGLLKTEYTDVGPSIDEETGLIVELDGVDLELGEQTLFDALSNDLLAFIGDEVFSVVSLTVIAENTYQILVARARFATPRQTHAVDSAVYLIRRSEILPLQHPQFVPNNTARFKLQPVKPPTVLELADVESSDVAISGRIYAQTPVTNLKINGLLDEVTFSTGAAIAITFTLTDAGRDYYQQRLLVRKTVLDFYDNFDALIATVELADGVSAYSMTNAEMIALLGGEATFYLTVRTKIISDWFIIFSEQKAISAIFI